MKKRLLFVAAMAMMTLSTTFAQRVTDKLTRGLVAVPQGDKTGQDERYGMEGSGIFVSWRILPSEYYDTKYNLYRDGTKIVSNLTASNYQDDNGTATSKYKVVPVVRGVERTDLASPEVKPWAHQYWDIPVKPVVGRDGKVVTGYSLNDCSVADVDGDGSMEFVVKRRNDTGDLRAASNRVHFNFHECYNMSGKLLWKIDMGPNLMAGPDEQFDLILYDWDGDGKAEAVMRGSDNMIIYTAKGDTIKIGNMNTGFGVERPEYMGVGNEYLLYLNGETGEPYAWDGKKNWTPEAYPLPQFEEDESYGSSAVWGDLGHRMMKHYFGAPYLDGRKPSIFLGRGCYTRHKFCALDVDPATHKLKQVWRWNCYQGGSPWFGNGFHNFAIADVDMDGRDEIVFGSMIIDDTGFGLATTGFGHGDAQHCGDLDPYRWGLEQYVCLESAAVPGIAYTDATSQTLRFTTGGGGDNGRSMAGNFNNSYPGAVGLGAGADAVSLVADKVITGLAISGDDYVNMRVYWDGDLLDEFMDSPGVERAPTVYKAPGQNEVGTNRTFSNGRCWMGYGSLNNSSKNNPCFLGDILGDWREEIVVRLDENTLRINITSYPSPHGITSLWYDHEYRNAMTWQCVGYNQPPHTSFFLGEMEGITNCPPAITLEGRKEVANGATIQTTDNQLLISGYENKTINVADGASPFVLYVNTPAWVKGSGAQQATTSTPKQPKRTVETYTTTLKGGAFSGATRLVKQGEGILVLPTVVEKHTGATDIWNGTLQFDGTLESSPLWLNRHTTLISNGGQFLGGLRADYNSTIYPGGKDNVGNITTTNLDLKFGSRIVLDFSADNNDKIKANTLKIDAKVGSVWVNYGPRYKAPIFQLVSSGKIAAGTYVLGEVESVSGNLSAIVLEGIDEKQRATLKHENGQLILVLADTREAGQVTWNGAVGNNTWQQATSENFLVGDAATVQVAGDDVIFDDNASSTTVTIKGAVFAKSVTFNNEKKSYTITGDSIIGEATVVKNGAGKVTLNNINHTGATTVNKGVLAVTLLANNSGQTWGALGSSSKPITLNDGATLQTNGIIITDQQLNINGEATVDVPSGKSVIFNKAIKGSGATLTKSSAGSMEIGTATSQFAKLIVKAGTVTSNFNSSHVEALPKTVEFQGGTVWAGNDEGTNVNCSSNFVIPASKTGTFYGGFRSTYTGSLTGAGTFNVFTGGVRCYYDGDWSQFTGTINVGKLNRQNKKTYDPVFCFRNSKGMPKATVSVAAETNFSNEGTSLQVKKMTGSGMFTGTGTWIIAGDDNFTLSPSVQSPVTKRGSGKMTMSAGRINGLLTVEDGVVAFNDSKLATLLNGDNGTTVKNKGRLVGQGKLKTLNVQSGGEVIPCGSLYNETTAGTLTVTTLLTFNAGSVAHFILGSSKSSTINAFNMTMNGMVKLTLATGYTPKEGDEFTLWTATGVFKGTPEWDLPALPEGLYWDTTDMAKATGVVRVSSDPANSINGLSDTANVTCMIFTADGKKVSTFTTTRKNVRAEASAQSLAPGVYVMTIFDGNRKQTKKVVIK